MHPCQYSVGERPSILALAEIQDVQTTRLQCLYHTSRADMGEVVDFKGQDAVQNTIWSRIHNQCFFLAETAPICQDRLRGEFGYPEITKVAMRF